MAAHACFVLGGCKKIGLRVKGWQVGWQTSGLTEAGMKKGGAFLTALGDYVGDGVQADRTNPNAAMKTNPMLEIN